MGLRNCSVYTVSIVAPTKTTTILSMQSGQNDLYLANDSMRHTIRN